MPQVVFRDYDRAALDREYDNRAKVKDAPEWLERYARESAKARAEISGRLDVAYGPSPGETLDVFPAPGLGAGAGPRVHPRRLLAPARQGRFQLRRARPHARRRGRGRDQLRAHPDGADG